ncbi:MAG: VCBS repeat-containing protein [Polyangia bacterium]
MSLSNPNAQTVQILDVNSDKLLDLAALTRDGKLRLWGGDGSGAVSFLSETAVNSGSTLSSAADLDGDGRVDLVLGGKASPSVVVLRNRGDGTFEELAANPLAAFPASTTLADLNGDGKLDAIAAEYAAGTTSVLLGRGDGTFEPRRPFTTGGSSRVISVGDINCDGRPDVAVSHLGGSTVTVLLGRGDGTFESSTLSVEAPGAIGAPAVALADLDHDGRADLLMGTDGLAPSVHLAMNTSQ